MRLASPRLLVAFAVVASTVFPSSASAMFIYNGFGADGGIVWDGGFDAATSNSLCDSDHNGSNGNDGLLCNSAALNPLIDPDALYVELVGGDSDLTFARDAGHGGGSGLFLLFSLPAASIDCSLFTYCGTLSDLGTLDNVFYGFASPANLNRVGDFTDPAVGLRQILAIQLPVSNPVSSGEHFAPPSGYLDLVDPALLADAHAGVMVHFTQTNPLPFSLDVVVPGVAPTPVPEPASLLLLGAGLAGAAARRYRRRTTASQS